MANHKQIKNVLERGVVKILPSKDKLAELMKKRKIKLYHGIDPTSPNLHLGHAIQLRKLREFQELGHEVILLFGTFTAQIGDPSGREKERKPLTENQVKENMATYQQQAAKVIDLSKVEIKHNDQWLSKLKFKQVLEITSNFTASQLLERDMFQKRIAKGKEIWINELLYPILQGYDSVALNIDLEVGATDQTFNMLIGRKLQKIYNNKQKFILTTPMLVGIDGRKMSKSYGNTVNLTDSPQQMYGKIMSLKDELIIPYFELGTEVDWEEIEQIKQKLEGKANPRDLKARLAREITALYHGKEKAEQAQQEFNRIFKKKKMPSEIPEVSISETPGLKAGKVINILDLLVKLGLTKSKSQAKRLISQRGIKINKKTQTDWKKDIKIKKGLVLQRGKRKFIKLVE